LPWADVLTTNYDTLLERAASGSARGYGIVRREGDLSGLRAPGIIKLHGTIEDDADLVITEEDCRRYPDKVNLSSDFRAFRTGFSAPEVAKIFRQVNLRQP